MTPAHQPLPATPLAARRSRVYTVRSESGQVAVIMAAFLAVMVGAAAMVLDVGSWYRADRAAQARQPPGGDQPAEYEPARRIERAEGSQHAEGLLQALGNGQVDDRQGHQEDEHTDAEPVDVEHA